jgi:hypothetical protein
MALSKTKIFGFLFLLVGVILNILSVIIKTPIIFGLGVLFLVESYIILTDVDYKAQFRFLFGKTPSNNHILTYKLIGGIIFGIFIIIIIILLVYSLIKHLPLSSNNN